LRWKRTRSVRRPSSGMNDKRGTNDKAANYGFRIKKKKGIVMETRRDLMLKKL